MNSLSEHPDVRSALRAAGVDEPDEAPYLHALSVLVTSNMLICKDSQ